MKSGLPFTGFVDERTGRIVLDRRDAFQAALQRWSGKLIVLTLSRPRRNVSLDQHGYYRAVVLPEFAEFVGEDDLAKMHFDLKDAFLEKREHVNRVTGEVVLVVPSLADLTMEEMSEFLDRVIREAGKMGKTITPARSALAS